MSRATDLRATTRRRDDRLRRAAWGVTLLYVVATYFSPVGSAIVWSLLHLALVFMLAVGIRWRPAFSVGAFSALFSWVCAILVILVVSPYPNDQLVRLSSSLLACLILFRYMRVSDLALGGTLLHRTLSVLLSVDFALYLVAPQVFLEVGGIARPLSDLAPLLPGALDKNRTALFVFIYFGLSLKRRSPYGLFLCAIYPLLYLGRQYVLMAALALVLTMWWRWRPLTDEPGRMRPRRIFVGIFLAAFAALVLSWVWTTSVIPEGVAGDRASMNDASNAMRTSSLRFAVEHMMERPQFVLHGYDSGLFQVFGIDLQSTARGDTHYLDDQWRLVQPHQEVINTVLKEGIAYSVIYYALVAWSLGTMRRTPVNMAILIAFIFGSTFVHDMLTKESLVALHVVLAVDSWSPLTSLGGGSHMYSSKRATRELVR